MPKRLRTKILVVFYIISAIPLIGYLILYFQLLDQNELTTQFIQKQQPIALSWVQLKSGMNRSLAAQRGWVLLGTEVFKEERAASWDAEITPMLERLKTLYADHRYELERAEEVRKFYDIRLALIELRQIQDAIESVANTPENIPSQKLFDTQIKPAFEVMISNLSKMLELSSSLSQNMITVIIELRGILWGHLSALHDYTQDGDERLWGNFQKSWRDNERLLLDLQSYVVRLSPLAQSYVRQVGQKHKAIGGLLETVHRERRQDRWNMAYYQMINEAIPLAQSIEQDIQKIVEWQSSYSQESHQQIQEDFKRWRTFFLWVALGVFFLGLFLSRLLGRQVVRPLRELRDTVRQVKNEDFYGDIAVSTHDEVGELAQEFQEMLDALSERTHDANRSRQILENSPFPVMMVTPELEIVTLNPAAIRELKLFKDLLPAKPNKMLGANIGFLLDAASIAHRQIAHPYTLPPTTDITLDNQIIEVTFSPLFDAEEQYIGPVLHWKNVTQERHSERDRLQLVEKLESEGEAKQQVVEQLEDQNQKLLDQMALDRAQTLIAKAINLLDINAILEAALETLVNNTNSQIGILYLADDSQEGIALTHYYSIDDGVMDDEFYRVNGLPLHVFQSQESVTIRHPSPNPENSFHLGAIQTYPAMIVAYPLTFQQTHLGVLLLASVSDYRETTTRFIENTIPQLAVSLQNASTFQTVQQQQQVLQAANLELEAATRMKSEFLANMSHELRTPLNAIIGFADTLLDTDEDNPLNDYQQDRLTRIHNSGKNLLALINSILDLSKIEAGKMEVHLSDFKLPELLDEVLGLMESLVKKKQLELHLECSDSLPGCHSDPDKIRQVLINLLGNAIKFTNEGHITVAVSEPKADWIRIDVIDTGIGIPGEQLSTIFEAFRQVDSTDTRHYEGTGLGLALVKNMGELIGGQVFATSQVGQGSTFSIEFPIQFSEE